MALKSMGFAVLASLCLSHSAEAQQTFDWKKYSGRTVNVALAKQPWSDFITPQIPEFEKLTGIKVRLKSCPRSRIARSLRSLSQQAAAISTCSVHSATTRVPSTKRRNGTRRSSPSSTTLT